MSIQHKNLTKEKWAKMSLCEQMANIGSEVNRALNWQKKDRKDFVEKAYLRALELLDLSLDCAKSSSQIKEFARLREIFVDYFYGTNQFSSSEALWRKYFEHFNYAARKNH